MNYYIRVISKNDRLQKYQLEQGENLVGRSRSANIRIKEPDVSGKHFIVRLNGDEISVENLSSKGIYLDDQMLFENAVVHVGQRILAGDALECIIEDEKLTQENDEQHFSQEFSQTTAPATAGGNQATAAENNPPTDTGFAADTEADRTNQSQDNSRTSDSFNTDASVHTEDSLNSHASANTNEDSRNTVANKTRVATPAEIEYLKEQKKNRVSRLRFVRIALVVLFVGVVACLVFLHDDKTDKKDGVWPVKANGAWNSSAVPFGNKGVKKGGFSLFYPVQTNTKTKVTENKILVNTALGQQKLIPLTLSLEFISGRKILMGSLTDCLKDWTVSQHKAGQSRWVFEKVFSKQFFGRGNGLPTVVTSYVREQNKKTWFGVVRIFRNADRAYILRAEVPFAGRERAEKILRRTSFLLISPQFVKEQWEGGVPLVKADWKTLRELRNRISTTSPIRLVMVQRQINGILADCTLRGDKAKLQVAGKMLLALRDAQAQCFNSLKIRFINAVLERNGAAAEKIKAEAAAVFSLDTDKRFYDIRTNKW